MGVVPELLGMTFAVEFGGVLVVASLAGYLVMRWFVRELSRWS